MATWKSENSMLTQRGVEILNKVKAGEGVITITRVVAGGGRTVPSDLYTLTSMPGGSINMSLVKRNIHETGSEIVVRISNDSVTTPFPLNQIGIFVTHPDYDEEQLYHISQCESGTTDTIPAFDVTPLTIDYSLFLEHGNSSDIQITVNPLGAVSKEEFEDFLSRAVAGNLFTVDEDKKLIDTGIPVSMVGASSRNLLHNWDFRDPVDTRGGFIVTSGSFYKEPELTTRQGAVVMAKVAVYVNEVYSTMGSYYVPTSAILPGYCGEYSTPKVGINRWILTGTGSSSDQCTYMQKDENGAILHIAEAGGSFHQDVARTTSPNKYGGKTYTLSAKIEFIEAINNGVPILYIDDGVNVVETPITGTGIFSVTATISTDATAFIVGIKNNHTTLSSSVQVSMMKLEVGNKSTLANEAPADYAEQMATCIQYDPDTDLYRGFSFITTANTLAEAEVTE